mmetsp:Transcript_10592/g.32559  ORF Transcript_10592/g.32559 Transcript_10592/m.32559 type:complete len:148 (+) Transcript_10592:876-1319(+)|eukprot:scaffold163549_cov31-Tisochrysis_lutea.AAC.4
MQLAALQEPLRGTGRVYLTRAIAAARVTRDPRWGQARKRAPLQTIFASVSAVGASNAECIVMDTRVLLPTQARRFTRRHWPVLPLLEVRCRLRGSTAPAKGASAADAAHRPGRVALWREAEVTRAHLVYLDVVECLLLEERPDHLLH